MELEEIKDEIPRKLFEAIKNEGVTTLRPAQEKAVKAGLLEGKNMLVCTPTASGKTLIAEMAAIKSIIETGGKTVYIVPLKSLASEKYNDFKRKYSDFARIALSIGDIDSSDPYLIDYDFIICTAEKFDSLIRHRAQWLRFVRLIVVDEIHLLNDPGRGPTLEILITLAREMLKGVQLIALSATIGNPEELAGWLNAKLIIDGWRPVKLHKGVFHGGKVEFKEKEPKEGE